MRTTETTLAVLPAGAPAASSDATSAHVTSIVSLTSDGTPEVYVGAIGGVRPARLAVPATRSRIETAIAERHPTVVVFENGDPLRPLILGFVEPLQPASSQSKTAGDASMTSGAVNGGDVVRTTGVSQAPLIEADLDGRRVRVTAKDEIVLTCGSASITLRRNGRVVIRGTYLETHSDGTNRIKGGQVQIN